MDEIRKTFTFTNDDYKKVMKLLLHAIDTGLSLKSRSESSLKMLPTYVTGLPNGTESGKFLSLDLGGTNFRVLLIELYNDGSEPKKFNKVYTVPNDVMLGPGDGLFDHIADCLVEFIKEYQIKDCYLPLGFTFSFPCDQLSLKKALLIKWTKGFQCSGVEGKDVVELLKQALKRKESKEKEEWACNNVGIVALINDTVGCLMSCAYDKKDCRVGVILGTGTNACFMEKQSNIEKLKEVVELRGDDKELMESLSDKEMIVNMEWGGFGDKGELSFVRNKYDEDVDSRSINKGDWFFEKMISGMYMGEIVRLVLKDLIDQQVLFKKGVDKEAQINEHGTFETKYVSMIEGEPEGESNNAIDVLKTLGVLEASMEECKIIKEVCQLVSTRAAFLASAGIATLINRVDTDFITVGVDGTLFRKHPTFKQLMLEKINELIDPKHKDKFALELSVDGSGVGAAVVAAVADRQYMQRNPGGVSPSAQGRDQECEGFTAAVEQK